MKTILVLLVALFLATGAYALNESDSRGQQNITSCYMIGTMDTTSGNVVVLTDDADTTRTIEFYGKEVTYSVTEGEAIYGVIVDSNNYTNADMATGKWIKVQTYGYVPNIKVETVRWSDSWGLGSDFPTVSAGDVLATSNVTGCAAVLTRVGASGYEVVTTNAIAMSAYAAREQEQGSVKGWLYW